MVLQAMAGAQHGSLKLTFPGGSIVGDTNQELVLNRISEFNLYMLGWHSLKIILEEKNTCF